MLSKKFIPILFIVLWNFLYSISGFAASISGVVVESKTQEPLAYVNIFLANTDQGSSSDLNGYYSITGIVPGSYQLIASHIGYETFKMWIDLKPGAKPFIEISLKPSPVAGDTVSVTARRKFPQGIEGDQILIGKSEMNIAPKLGEPDLFRVIETFPGVTTVNDFNMGLYIRGGNSDQNLILLDGMPIYNPFHLMGIFSTFDEEAIQRTNVSKSRIDPIYGNRLSSVIDINVRDGIATEHEGYVNLSFLSSKLRAEGPHPLGTYLVTIRRTYADLFVNTLNDIGILPPELRLPYYFVDGMGKLVIKPGNRQRLEITTYMGRDVYDLADIDDDPGSGKYTWQNSASGLNYSAILSPYVAFYLRTSTSQFKSQWLPPDTTNAESIDNIFTGKIINAYLKVENRLLGKIKAGGEFNYNKYHLRTKGFSYQQIYFEDNSQYENSVFVDLFKQFGALLCFNGGFRMTRFSLQDTMTFSPQLSCGARISPTQEINLHWGKYHQDLMTIGTEEIILSMFDAWVTVPENLPVMSAEQYALSYKWDIHRNLALDIALYHKRFSHLVEYNTTKFSAIDPDFVAGTGTANGLEILFKGNLKKIQGWLSYSYSQVRKTVNGISYPPKYDRPHDLDLVLNYRLSEKWSIGSRFVYHSGTPFTKIIGYMRQPIYEEFRSSSFAREVEVYGKRNAWRYPAYHRLDINFIKKFDLKSRPMEFYIDIANVYARLNVLAYSEHGDTWIQMPPLATIGIRGKIW
ncbi:MAG: TonB-dependent receptor [Candidatus Marinimicrobia bacterium]|nr:TonB-dependent receptor [bacterium]MCG2717011.1 TonB-dependent receptor [Candidatus Neomarinimicrobiota bacterium]